MEGSLFSSEKTLFGDETEDTELNMIAFLSILSNMLFFLLASFGIAIISLIAANVPTIAEADEVFTVSKDKVTATLTISRKGLSVTAVNEMMDKAEARANERKFPRKRGRYDWDGLNDFLYRIKKKYKSSDTIVITPDPGVPYEILVRAMDATREKVVEVEGKKLRYPLFPGAVISQLMKK